MKTRLYQTQSDVINYLELTFARLVELLCALWVHLKVGVDQLIYLLFAFFQTLEFN